MENKNKNIWMIGCIISIVVIICLVVYIVAISIPKGEVEESEELAKGKTATSQKENETSSNSEEDDFRQIRIDEDFSKDGKIEGIENVRWHNARIMQDNGKMEVDIMINNESKEEKIPAKKLNVKLLNKSGKVIAEKDIEMKEIPANYGYTSLDMKFDMKEIAVVYDIQISVKQ